MSEERIDPLALVIIPTYNESENIESIVSRVLAAAPSVRVLVVDDGSPDGTGRIADRLSSEDHRVHVLHRTEKNGLGAAYLAGFSYGISQGYSLLIELDADGSHPPERLPALISAVTTDTTGRVGGSIGSRWVRGGSVVNWPWTRQIISRGGSWYARTMLGLPIRDVTAGYRVYRSDVLEQILAESVESRGYCFQIDLTRRVIGAGYGLVEVPIEFREREAGESKMSGAIVKEAMVRVTQWGFERIFRH
ncbi:polyprenol monophosphomannose synthase [Microbacterium invictum]|uniref:Polyprenol monophosphomannose synthase n=1 Tax=Microbacterium invictum TaxID=515415 RepID=A0ABZ0V7N4_9MICO|nr:polyprenol monophosphomannose synthase [Microbacterium invictum]WQB69479.1 polyprenol monophosphomannose synthase [Microbacterium invictum]